MRSPSSPLAVNMMTGTDSVSPHAAQKVKSIEYRQHHVKDYDVKLFAIELLQSRRPVGCGNDSECFRREKLDEHLVQFAIIVDKQDRCGRHAEVVCGGNYVARWPSELVSRGTTVRFAAEAAAARLQGANNKADQRG